MAQYWCELYLWEALFNSNPHIKKVVELGTWLGGFSLFLKWQTEFRNIDFVTYDSVDFNTPAYKVIPYIKKDIFAHQDDIANIISRVPTILLCDNGNKPREVKTFAPYLSSDSLLVVHDWGTEIFEKDIPNYLEELYGDFCDEIGSISRVFRKKVE